MLQPGETKGVIALNFAAGQLGLHKGYVHVLTDFDHIIMPVEVNVQPADISVSKQTHTHARTHAHTRTHTHAHTHTRTHAHTHTHTRTHTRTHERNETISRLG